MSDERLLAKDWVTLYRKLQAAEDPEEIEELRDEVREVYGELGDYGRRYAYQLVQED